MLSSVLPHMIKMKGEKLPASSNKGPASIEDEVSRYDQIGWDELTLTS